MIFWFDLAVVVGKSAPGCFWDATQQKAQPLGIPKKSLGKVSFLFKKKFNLFSIKKRMKINTRLEVQII